MERRCSHRHRCPEGSETPLRHSPWCAARAFRVDHPLLSVALFLVLLGVLLGALLAPAPIAAQEWQPATPGYPWEFPDDHWAHVGYQTEWWYFVGFAESADGSERFAWQFTLFRTGLTLAAPPAAPSPWRARHVAMGHAAVADLGSGERVFTQTVHREAPGLARFGVFPDPEIAWMHGPPGTPAPWFLDLPGRCVRVRRRRCRTGTPVGTCRRSDAGAPASWRGRALAQVGRGGGQLLLQPPAAGGDGLARARGEDGGGHRHRLDGPGIRFGVACPRSDRMGLVRSEPRGRP